MPRVSKTRELTSEKQRLFLDDFYSAVTSLKNKDEVKAFFEDLLTREEKLMLGKRFQIAMMHKLGYFWGEINERVKVTNDTVAKISQKKDFGLGGLNKVAERIIAIKKEKLERIEKGKGRSGDLGTAVLKGGLGILVQKKKESQKKGSITD